MLRQLRTGEDPHLREDSPPSAEPLLRKGGKLLRFTADERRIRRCKAKTHHLRDDIGTENLSVKYGEKRLSFAELADEAEKKGKLLILTTNLSIDELREKYGERTIDRLRAITRTVLFSGESLRK